jgi:hypothetical protein
MTDTRPTPLSARVFLFGEGEGSVGELVRQHGVDRSLIESTRRLSTSALAAVNEEIDSVADGLLDMDLGDALVAGWQKHKALVDAARRTVGTNAEEVLPLVSHRASASYRPRLDLLIDGVRVNSFEFALSLRFDITGVSAVVRSGELVALHGGHCLVTATLSLEGAPLAQRQRRVELHALVPLSHPIALLPKPEPRIPEQARPPDIRPGVSRPGPSRP